MNNPNGIKASNILPDDVKVNLAAWAQQEDKSIWAIARTAQLLAEELPVRKSILDAAIAQACNAGWKASRVRDVRSVASYYSEAIVAAYPALSFSHFRTAMSAGKLNKSINWLTWCVESADNYGGHIAPVDVLAAKMQSAGDNDAAPVWKKQLASAYRLVTKVYHSPEISEDVAGKAYRIMETFEAEFPELAEE